MEAISYIIIFGIIIGLSLFFNYFTFRKMNTLLIWVMIFTCFFVWISLIDFWILIILIIINTIFIVIELYKRKGGII